MKFASPAHAFRQGWSDRINGVPPQDRGNTPCDMTTTAICLGYERGRHAAALHEFDLARRGKGTINNVAGITGWAAPSYADARRGMSPELRRMIDHERRFVALRARKKNPLTGL